MNTVEIFTGKVLIDDELIPVYTTSNGDKVIYGSDLHKRLFVKSNYREWVNRRFSDVDAIENEDYQTVEIPTPSGQKRKEHIIKLDIAKEMAMLEGNDEGKKVRRHFIAIEKKYRNEVSIKSPAEMLLMYAQQFCEVEKKLAENESRIGTVENNIKTIEAKIETHNEDYFTISGYASLRGIKVDISKCNMLGRKASKISKEYGYDTGKAKDVRFGQVNTYHTDI